MSLVALLSAAPADDKQTLSRPSPINPDVISDPKPKSEIHSVDDGHDHTHPEHVNLHSETVNGGATAHPLHKRESPKVVDQNPAAPQPNLNNGQKTPPQVNAPKAQVNGQQRPVNNNQKPKQSQTNNNNNNNQKSGQTQTNNQQKPTVNAQQPIAAQKPITNARVTRDVTPKVAEQKPAVPQNNNQKSGSAQLNTQQKPVVSNARVTRDVTPKNAEQKPAVSQSNDAKKDLPTQAPAHAHVHPNNHKADQETTVHKSAPQQPITNPRVTRDAPNPAEQSKYVPSAHQASHEATTTESNGFQTGLFKIESITTPSSTANKDLSEDAKKVQSAAAQHTSEHTQSLPVHKRETQSATTNIREPVSSQSYDSYGNQAPSYVHPKPIEEVLKLKPKSAHHEATES